MILSVYMCAYTAGIVCLLGHVVTELRKGRAEALVARLTAPLPPARDELTPLDWPHPLSPLDLPGIGHTAALAAIPGAPRVFRPEPAPLVAELVVAGGGRHRLGAAPGTEAQRALWDSPTGQFWQLVEELDDPWVCTHCASPEDGEQPHARCPGCACPCSLVEAVAV